MRRNRFRREALIQKRFTGFTIAIAGYMPATQNTSPHDWMPGTKPGHNNLKDGNHVRVQ